MGTTKHLPFERLCHALLKALISVSPPFHHSTGQCALVWKKPLGNVRTVLAYSLYDCHSSVTFGIDCEMSESWYVVDDLL